MHELELRIEGDVTGEARYQIAVYEYGKRTGTFRSPDMNTYIKAHQYAHNLRAGTQMMACAQNIGVISITEADRARFEKIDPTITAVCSDPNNLVIMSKPLGWW